MAVCEILESRATLVIRMGDQTLLSWDHSLLYPQMWFLVHNCRTCSCVGPQFDNC